MATTVAQSFDEFRSKLELNASLQNAVSTHHNAVRKWIENYGLNIETQLIGSLQRKTRIQPRADKDSFDIDILVKLGSFGSWLAGGITPSDALDKVENIVSQNTTYNLMGPETDSPTIVIEYADNLKVELVPAYLDNIGYTSEGTPLPPTGRGYWIPMNNKWIMADYDYDAEYITTQNQTSNGYLVPLIKMLKAAKRYRFDHMESYHLEILLANFIIEIIDSYEKRREQISFPKIVADCFLMLSIKIINSVKIPGSKSPPGDAYMLPFKKHQLAQMFKEISDYCYILLGLEDRQAIEGWQKVFGESFPSYG